MLLGVALWASPAEATTFRVKRFEARDVGSRIHFGITVCGNRHTVHFKIVLENEDTNRDTPFYFTGGRHPGGCFRWFLGVEDDLDTGLYLTQATVVLGSRVHRSRIREFYVH